MALLALAAAAPVPGALLPPVGGTCVTSAYGPRHLAYGPLANAFHHGIDLRAGLGAPVRAVAAGEVVGIDRKGAGGLEVLVRHAGFTALYAHLGRLTPALLRGKRSLAAGEQIGVIGYSGLTFGPHLYFELRIDGQRVDPAPYLHVSPCR
jgi:murein DD-endopeptidase MepM/ murein hydrolase activator NlpD